MDEKCQNLSNRVEGWFRPGLIASKPGKFWELYLGWFHLHQSKNTKIGVESKSLFQFFKILPTQCVVFDVYPSLGSFASIFFPVGCSSYWLFGSSTFLFMHEINYIGSFYFVWISCWASIFSSRYLQKRRESIV